MWTGVDRILPCFHNQCLNFGSIHLILSASSVCTNRLDRSFWEKSGLCKVWLLWLLSGWLLLWLMKTLWEYVECIELRTKRIISVKEGQMKTTPKTWIPLAKQGNIKISHNTKKLCWNKWNALFISSSENDCANGRRCVSKHGWECVAKRSKTKTHRLSKIPITWIFWERKV